MKKIKLIIIGLLSPLLALADGWTTEYKQIEQSIVAPTFADREFNITKYGAKTTATATVNQKAINQAIEKCSKKGGGRVVVPAGTWHTGAIRLRSNVNLVVEKDAKLQFVFEPDLYPVVPTSWEGLDCNNISPCIYAFKEKNIAITGDGTIDGGGNNDTWWKWCGATQYGWKPGITSQRNGSRARLLKYAEDGVPKEKRNFTKDDGLRPQLINVNECENILIENVRLLDSPFWVIHPLLSKNITVRGVHIDNDGPNGDGCDPEACEGVLIENCYFNTGDDCIAIKSFRNNDGRLHNQPSQNIIIRGCKMNNGHGGVVIGSEISGGCRNVYAENNEMDSPNLDRVVRIKTNTCRGGIIENINVRNIKVGQCNECVLKINLDYEPNEICCRGFIPTVRNINIENITCEKSKYGVMVVALPNDCNVYDINIKDCRFNGVAQGNSIAGQTRNIRYDNYFVNGSLQLTEKPYKTYSEWMTYSEMKRTPKSFMLDFSTKPKWSYVMGIELEGMLDTYLKYGGDEILKYCQEYTDTMINQNGDIRGYNILDYNLDNIRTGHFVQRMYELYPEDKNLKAIKTMMKQLEDQPRTIADKVYWHKAIYAYQVWLDGIFMGLPFYALSARDLLPAKQAEKIYDDAVNQISITYKRTLDPKTSLNRHAYDETRNQFWADKETGLSQHCWGRAQGWFTMALIELLDAFPENYSRRGEVIELLKKDFDAILKWQDKTTGVWYQVMDSPKREGNYLESTCSAMFTYALLKAYRKGYVGAQYRDAGIRAYKGMINNFIRVNEDKTISLTNCCSVAGLGPGYTEQVEAAMKKINPKAKLKENKRRDGGYEYYLSEKIRDNDAKGLGPFIWASLEMEALGYNTDNVTTAINRQAVTSRNNPVVTEADPLSALSVGNGHIAATVDFTGLQSFPETYKDGLPLNTMSDWGWHSFDNTEHVTTADTEKAFDLGHGHSEVYAVEFKQAGTRNKAATDYFRVNPHRLNLGTLGFVFKDRNGNSIGIEDIHDIKQELQLWHGKIETTYKADGEKVEVTTSCAQDKDMIFARIKSNLLKDKRASIQLTFSYPTGKHADDANDWTKPNLHQSKIVNQTSHSAIIERTIDATKYFVKVVWDGNGKFAETAPHTFALTTDDNVITFATEYSAKQLQTEEHAFEYEQALKGVVKAWPRFWAEGAIVDFGECTDSRAKELERRVVLSQYLTQINCANSSPAQETGLTYNSWFGRPHLEMTWWHAVDFSLWNRPTTLAAILAWYNNTAYPVARKIAERQGFKGVRWMKMTDPWAGEAPSNTGSFLIWQQPHYIYMAEELYRHDPSEKTLKNYGKQVEATAEFMADFVSKKTVKAGKTVKTTYFLQGATAMQESMSKDFSFNHPFELAYWQYGLRTANNWRERQGLQRNTEWDKIADNMAQLTEKNGIYTAGMPLYAFDKNSRKQPQFDPFVTPEQQSKSKMSEADFNEKSRSDHPAVLGAVGLLPESNIYNKAKMKATLDWVMKNWNWDTTWGWDYGMVAMAAARLGEPETALNALLNDKQKNTYLVSGHNYQNQRLRLYLPGNGSLLDAVAMMCAGWDGCNDILNPGFPKDGKWNVRWEGLQKMQ